RSHERGPHVESDVHAGRRMIYPPFVLAAARACARGLGLRIAVVGTGYVGLVVGTCLAENGNAVVCVDNDETKVAALRRGEVPIYEPGLEEMISRNVAEERLSFSTDLAAAVRASEILFIAVGTPQGEDGSA